MTDLFFLCISLVWQLIVLSSFFLLCFLVFQTDRKDLGFL